MASECPSLYNDSVKGGLLLSSFDLANGSLVTVTCACSDRSLVGNSTLLCLTNGQWSSQLPTCTDNHHDTTVPDTDTEENDELTERELLIISVSAAVVGVLLLTLAVVVVWVYCAKERRKLKMSERLQSRLDSLSIRDPLDELVRRESRRGLHNPSFTTTTSLSTSEFGGNRYLYKIWNHTRSKKQFAFAESLPELYEKAAQRLSLQEPLRIVLDEDGTEVTSDDILQACQGAVLVVMQPGERWRPAPEGGGVNGNGGVGSLDSGVGGSGRYGGECGYDEIL